MVAGSKNADDSGKKQDTYIAPPTLFSEFTATNSARISISGSALPKQSIKLYLNDREIDETRVSSDNSFSFDGIALKSGSNSLKAKAVNENQRESEYSEAVFITFLNNPPKLEVTSPEEGKSFSKDEKSIEVRGKTDSGVKVTVNDFWAIVDTDGSFTYTLPLKDGENQIRIAATDPSGNKTEKSLKVTYTP